MNMFDGDAYPPKGTWFMSDELCAMAPVPYNLFPPAGNPNLGGAAPPDPTTGINVCPVPRISGFTWDVLLSMGGDVKTLSYFNVGLEDLKTYWNPTQAQWYEAGFYDKSRVIEAGWDIEHVTRLLPELDGRLSGRTLRLQF